MANSLFTNSRYFTPDPNKKRRTDAFLPVGAENFTPSPTFQNRSAQEQPDFTGGLQGMALSQSGEKVLPNEHPLTTMGTITQPHKSGPYDYWKTPVVGKMPLDQFVQLTGMMANAVAPDEWSGRLGKQMAAVATQADIDRRDYEEREQQRADINKKYEDQQKEKRMDKALEFAMKTDNAPLAKAAYGQLKGQWEQDFGVPLPDWNPEATPDLMKQLSAYKKGAKELGLSPEEQKKGEAEILLAGGEINGKEYLEATYPKAEKENETWSDPYETNVGGKKALVQKSSTGKITPVIQDKSTTVITPGDKSKTKEKLAVYVDTVNGARHVVDLNNQKHREWLAKYGKQLRAEKDFEKDVVTPEEGTETSDPLGIR